ncbi:hypothetical protein D9613_001098 [Agrocybe pediades]|uniref:BTB domain-containing protein n=1 Tax=Agrocybe pediades TaxID=84607 RepID=A0A8H4R191_9AGAR|nr:hypothetical protein D9613_001098 [Agrocybe pediades]
MTVKNDDQFYFTGHYVILQAGDTRFRVPNEVLTRESQFFADMFSLPVPASEAVEGGSDDKPIVFPQTVRAESFRSLLKILYSSGGTVALDKSEWLSVLELATMWYFLERRKTAIGRLTNILSPVEKIYYGRMQKVAVWLQQGYTALVERDATITNDEALALTTNSGSEHALTAFFLLRIREKKERALRGSGGKGRRMSPFNTDMEVGQEFGEELRSIREMEGAYGVVEKLVLETPEVLPEVEDEADDRWY